MSKVILEYISEVLINEELEDALEIQDDLLGSGILDSLGMMKLISFLEIEFDLKVAPEEMIIENFMTVEHINEYLKTKSTKD